MKDRATALADEALLLCGTDFRLHGRDAETGLDCIGLAGLCISAADLQTMVPTGYSMRGGNVEVIIGVMEQAGFEKVCHQSKPLDGDVLLVRVSPVQLHFMIRAYGGYVHAHAGLRKIVLSPGSCPWPILEIFRIVES
ncbi:MAG: peptidoglycan endopeptidase [Parasphingorhabdus sp.]